MTSCFVRLGRDFCADLGLIKLRHTLIIELPPRVRAEFTPTRS